MKRKSPETIITTNKQTIEKMMQARREESSEEEEEQQQQAFELIAPPIPEPLEFKIEEEKEGQEEGEAKVDESTTFEEFAPLKNVKEEFDRIE